MGASFYQQVTQALNNAYARIEAMDNQIKSITHVLQEIVGKELMRGQALHKVLMDKALFTDEELKGALEKMIEESKAELKKEAERVKAEKNKIEILVPQGANLKPPTGVMDTQSVQEQVTPNPEV